MKEGWEIKKLGEVCYSKSSNVSQNKLTDEVGDYPIFGASGLIKNVSFYHQDKPYLSIVKDGSGVGRVTKMEAYTSVIGTLQYIIPNEGVDLDYLNYSLMSVDFKKYVAGAAIPHIYFKDYKNEPFLWMPFEEQQRIVTILDECFAVIDKAKANVEQNLKNARELFESYLQGVFEKKGDGWEEKKLGETCIVERGSSPRPIEKYQTNSPDGVNWIKIGDTKGVDKYIESTKEKITKEGAEKSRYVKEGDFILSNSMSFGKPYIMKIDGYIHDGWFVFRLPNYIDKDYFYYLLISPNVQKQIQSLGAGAIVKNISGDLVKKVDVFYPTSVIEQQTIVRQLDTLRVETQKLEAVYQQKVADLVELKKSILVRAFSGEL